MQDLATLLFLIQLTLVIFLFIKMCKETPKENKSIMIAETSLCILIVESIMLFMYLQFLMSIGVV